MKAVSAVLPFRVNGYVIEDLIDWSAVPDDPIFRLVFPQPGMLHQKHLERVRDAVARGMSDEELKELAGSIQRSLNAYPAGQKKLNVPWFEGHPMEGIQHKYRETVLFFPAAGQTCHSHCSYCFRWAQFSSPNDFRFEGHETRTLVRYLREHPEVTNVLVTGGDPLVMTAPLLRQYLEPLLDPSLEHLRSIRIGTKATTFWPYRFFADEDSDELLRLFEEVVAAGKHLAIMAHYSHPRELATGAARKAVRKIRETGAVIRGQSPMVRGVNDDPDVWAELWRTQVSLGVIPYYTFLARDTGAQHYFKIPLHRALAIFNRAYRQVSGLGRTVRGPVMSATPGKVLVDGLTRMGSGRAFVLKFIQAREPSWVGRPFFARFDAEAAWLDDLEPASGADEFFFQPRFRELMSGMNAAAS